MLALTCFIQTFLMRSDRIGFAKFRCSFAMFTCRDGRIFCHSSSAFTFDWFVLKRQSTRRAENLLGLYRLVKGIVLAREKFLASLRDSINVPPFGTPRGTHATRQGTHGTVDPYDERDVPGTRLGYKVEQEGGWAEWQPGTHKFGSSNVPKCRKKPFWVRPATKAQFPSNCTSA